MVVQAVIAGKAGKPILTVTTLDAEIYGLTEPEVAEAYAQRIRYAFLRALQERQPSVQQSQLVEAVASGASAIALIASLLWWQRRVGKSRQRLRQDFHNLLAVSGQQIATEMETDTTQIFPIRQQQFFDLKRRIEQKTAERHLLQLLSLGVGVLGIGWVLQRFPQSRSLGVFVVRQPIGLLLIGVTVVIVIISSRAAIDWL